MRMIPISMEGIERFPKKFNFRVFYGRTGGELAAG
jgi:hypothetical protein